MGYVIQACQHKQVRQPMYMFNRTSVQCWISRSHLKVSSIANYGHLIRISSNVTIGFHAECAKTRELLYCDAK